MQPTRSSSVPAMNPHAAPEREQVVPEHQIEGLDQSLIADLLNEQIRQMTREELIRVIEATTPPILNAACQQRLTYFDRTTLERLVFLSRYCCQNRISRSAIASGKGCHARFIPQEK